MWTIEGVAAELERNRRDELSCAVLAGAGCSVTAGIPLASTFVDIIAERFPDDYARAAVKDYPHCMGVLRGADRHALIAEYIDQAKINWAHIALAQLIKHGYVDRVLTTNFDPLAMRAAALIGLYPAVYDMAVVGERFVPDFVRERAVFHLHGQRDGFVQLHERQQVDALEAVLQPVFQDTARRRTWLVIGYSGGNDPVFRRLAALPRFQHRLFWIGYRDEQPSEAVQGELLGAGKDAHWLTGHDADNFLVRLASRLGCFPPEFFGKPFSHLLHAVQSITGFRLPGQEEELDWAVTARNRIQRAIAQFEAPPAAKAAEALPSAKAGEEELDPVSAAWAAVMAGEYDKALAFRPLYDRGGAPALKEPLSAAYFGLGNAFCDQAKTKTGADADRLFAAAGEKYAKALEIKPDRHEALNNWGAALADQAKTKAGDEADRLFAEAGKKYAKALEIKPDDYETRSNWATALILWSYQKSGEDARRLLSEAEEKGLKAEAIEPGSWAYDLACIAALTAREEACRQWLQVARDHGRLPNRAHLETDGDLKAVREEPWFKDFLAGLGD